MGVGQYLPNGLVMTPLFRLDDYSFHSALPRPLCLGWHADDRSSIWRGPACW